MEKIKLGISSCLLGNPVRYDGGHKLDTFLKDIVGQFVEWVAVCPEVECGLSVPRESMRLVGDKDNPKLITNKTKIDYTDQMISFAKKRVKELKKEGLSGFVFKSRSPSSGFRDVKIYDEDGMPIYKGSGLFARVFMEENPLIPVEDEGRLKDPELRENFFERVFIYHRWQMLDRAGMTKKALVEFHSRIKIILLAHSPAHYKELGKLVSNLKDVQLQELKALYIKKLMEGLRLKATRNKNVNVLYHIMGYFKRLISSEEKTELIELIERYKKEELPLIVPITLINHYVRKFNIDYLKEQVYLNPAPFEFRLRNY